MTSPNVDGEDITDESIQAPASGGLLGTGGPTGNLLNVFTLYWKICKQAQNLAAMDKRTSGPVGT